MTGTYQEALASLGTTYAIFTVGLRGLAVVGIVLIIDSHASFLSQLSKSFSNVNIALWKKLCEVGAWRGRSVSGSNMYALYTPKFFFFQRRLRNSQSTTLVSSRDLNQIFNESSLCRIRRLKATYATSVTMQSPGLYMSRYLADQRFQSGLTHTHIITEMKHELQLRNLVINRNNILLWDTITTILLLSFTII